jgi:hypothetical protein
MKNASLSPPRVPRPHDIGDSNELHPPTYTLLGVVISVPGWPVGGCLGTDQDVRVGVPCGHLRWRGGRNICRRGSRSGSSESAGWRGHFGARMRPGDAVCTLLWRRGSNDGGWAGCALGLKKQTNRSQYLSERVEGWCIGFPAFVWPCRCLDISVGAWHLFLGVPWPHE